MIRNQWYAILSSKDVISGKLLGVKRMGLNLCLFRDEKGEVGCVVDHCCHRGAALSKGKLKGNHVACPFHGLEFDKNGQCVLIPANGHNSKIENRFHVKKYEVKEIHGIIYLWFGEGEPNVLDIPFFEGLEEGGKGVYSEITELWDAHYSRCIENQLDVVHVPFVHYNTIGRGHKTLVNGPGLEIFENRIVIHPNNVLDEGQEPKPAESIEENGQMNLSFVFPNIWQNKINEHLKIIIFFAPVDDDKTMFYIRFYANQSKFKFINQLIAQFGKIGNRIVERQDKPVVETQEPKASELISGENLIKGDSPIIAYRRIRQQLKDKNK